MEVVQKRYNNNIMKTLLLSLLLIVLVTSPPVAPNPQMGFDIVGPLTATAFGCLVQQGYTYAIVRADSDTPGTMDPNALQTLENAQIAGLSTDVYAVVCPSLGFFTEMIALVNTIPKKYYSTLWFKLVQNHPGCSWQGIDVATYCQSATWGMSSMATLGLSVGIFSTKRIWDSLFGTTCNIGNSGVFKLWFADYQTDGVVDPTESFADFTAYGGFGGWTQPYLKQVGGTVPITNLCNNPAWHALIDINWRQ